MKTGTFVTVAAASSVALLTGIVLVATAVSSSKAGKPYGRPVASESVLHRGVPIDLQSTRNENGKLAWWWSCTTVNTDSAGPFQSRDEAIANVRHAINVQMSPS